MRTGTPEDASGVVAESPLQQKSKTGMTLMQIFACDRISSPSVPVGGFGGEDLRILGAIAGRQKITLGQGTCGESEVRRGMSLRRAC
jgi:hypothetical protein